MATATGQAPVSNNTPSYGGNWGNARFNKYYNRYLNDIPLNTVDYNALSTQEQSVDELAAEVAAYLDPQLNTTEKNLRRQLRNNYNDIDAGGASKGMSRSTWVTDAKNAAYNAGMDTLADAYNNYGSALASGVSERYENYLARRQGIDEQNARNQLEVDKYNSQVKTAQEQLAYQRAANAYNWTKPKAKRGGSKSNEEPFVEYGPKVATTTKRRISGQYEHLM